LAVVKILKKDDESGIVSGGQKQSAEGQVSSDKNKGSEEGVLKVADLYKIVRIYWF